MIRKILVTVLLLAGLCRVANANFSGSDNFSGSVDASKWGSDTLLSGSLAQFTQSNQHLYFSNVGSTGGTDQVVHPWIANTGSYTQNWSLQLDVNIPQFSLTGGQEISMGLAVLNSADNNDVLVINFQQDPQTPNSIFVSGLNTDTGSAIYEQRTASEITSASVAINWNAATDSLTTSYNTGSGWSILTTQNITSSGSNNWGMNSSSTFEAAIVGFAIDNQLSTSNNVYISNFQAVPEPSSLVVYGLEGFALLWGFRRIR